MDSEHDSKRGVPTRAEMRAALVKRQGEALVSAFERSTVAVCGLGGLGSAIALSLARAGVGRLILIDFDRLDVTNLHRQQYLLLRIAKTVQQSQHRLSVLAVVAGYAKIKIKLFHFQFSFLVPLTISHAPCWCT